MNVLERKVLDDLDEQRVRKSSEVIELTRGQAHDVRAIVLAEYP